jgi:hypothetical protein
VQVLQDVAVEETVEAAGLQRRVVGLQVEAEGPV